MEDYETGTLRVEGLGTPRLQTTNLMNEIQWNNLSGLPDPVQVSSSEDPPVKSLI